MSQQTTKKLSFIKTTVPTVLVVCEDYVTSKATCHAKIQCHLMQAAEEKKKSKDGESAP